MICQPVIFKKAKKVGEDFEQAGNEGKADLNAHAQLHTAYIWKKQIRTRICRKNEGEMKEKDPAIIKLFTEDCKKFQKVSKKARKRY